MTLKIKAKILPSGGRGKSGINTRVAILSKMSSFQQKIVRHANKHITVTDTHEKR